MLNTMYIELICIEIGFGIDGSIHKNKTQNKIKVHLSTFFIIRIIKKEEKCFFFFFFFFFWGQTLFNFNKEIETN